VGLPAATIPRIIIPLFSSVTLLPFFLLVKHFYGARVGFIASLLLCFAPYQFRFMADLYKNVIGNFFLFLSLYYILTERKTTSYKSLISTVLLFLSYIPGALILVTTILILSLLKKDKALFRKILLVAAISSVASLSPIWAIDFGKWVIAKKPISLQPNKLLELLYDKDIYYLLSFSVPLLVFVSPSIRRLKRSDFTTSFLGCLAIFLFLSSAFDLPSDRTIMFFEFPLVVLAAQTIGKTKNYQYLAFLAVGWELLQSMWMLKLSWLYGPSRPWPFYASRIAGMPSLFLEPSLSSWLLSSFLFTAILMTLLLVMKGSKQSIGE